MRKIFVCIVLIVAMLFSCGAADSSGGFWSGLLQSAQSFFESVGIAPTKPPMPQTTQSASTKLEANATIATKKPKPTPSPKPSPTPKQTPTPSPSPTPLPTPEKYTMEWALRYAPSSCASFEEQVGDNGIYLEEKDIVRPSPDTYRIVVDYYNQAVWAYSQDMHGNYTVLERVMICTTGGNGNWTPEGTYHMDDDYKRFGYFTSFDCYAQYWTQMAGSFYFHSVLYSERDASTLSKSSYKGLGKPGSHGCIRMLVPDARWIYENCAPGTWCEVTTAFPKDQQLKDILKHGVEGAIDYVAPPESEAQG